MGAIERVSSSLSKNLGSRLNKNDEEIAVINYGLFNLLHTSIAIVFTIIIGIITNTLVEIMIITISSAILKRYSGGVHATSPERCTIIGIILTYFLAIICIYINKNVNFINTVMIIIGINLISYYILYKRCPVGSKNKPLKKESTRKKLRKKAFKLVNTYMLIILICISIYYINKMYILKQTTVSITLGISLQVLVLTKFGKKLINTLDKLLNIKFYLKRS